MRNRWGSHTDRRLHRLQQDLRVMRRVFPWRTTAALLLAIVAMACLFRAIYTRELDEPLSYVQAVYAVLNMIFFQLAYTDVPSDLDLAPFFVLVPVIGLSLFSLLGFNIFQVLRVFFVRRERGQHWQEALASTYSDHVVVCGLGSVGFRVALQLAELGQTVVGVELTRTELVQTLIDADLPVILGNICHHDVLAKAGVAQATTVVVCTNSDMDNIQAAFHVRELNPRARLVLRIFEDDIAQSVESGGEIDAVLSRSAIAALAFAHAAIGIDVLETFHLNDANYVLARVPLRKGSSLVGATVAEVEQDQDVTIAFLCRGRHLVNEPCPETRLQPDDDLFLFAASERLMALVHHVVPSVTGDANKGQERHIIVCGLGHVGYRVVNILQTWGYSVVALHRESSHLTQRLTEQDTCVHIADFRRGAVLDGAGILHAQAIVICSDDDMLNLETGLRARELNPDIRVVMRIFDEQLGRRLSRAFGIDAVFSTSALTVPAFVGAALKLHLAQTVTIGHEDWALTRLPIESTSGLIGQTIQQLNAEDELTVVLHARRDRLDVPPRPEAHLRAGDEVVVLVSPDRLRQLSQLNRSVAPARGRWL
jgi:Trk K+ transport system NAD-binding subunit